MDHLANDMVSLRRVGRAERGAYTIELLKRQSVFVDHRGRIMPCLPVSIKKMSINIACDVRQNVLNILNNHGESSPV